MPKSVQEESTLEGWNDRKSMTPDPI
jgi:hypothetical protein